MLKDASPTDASGQAADEAGLDVATSPSAPHRWYRHRWVTIALVLALSVVLVLALLPMLLLFTPPGQRLVERVIETPLLERLEAAAPAPFQLTVDQLDTRVGGATLTVRLEGAVLAAPGVSLTLNGASVRIRHLDVLRGNTVPDRITVETALLRVDNLAPMQALSPEAEAHNRGFLADEQLADADLLDPRSSSAIAPSDPAGEARSATPEMLASLRLDGLVNAFDALDQALTQITVGETWQSLKAIAVRRIEIAQRPDAGVPFLRDPASFQLRVERLSDTEMVARATSIERADPIHLVIRHSEDDVPEGPAVLAQTAGAELHPDQAFSHIWLRGIQTSDLTDALQGDGPVSFESSLAAEIIVTRDQDDDAIDQIVALFESEAGYLIAGQREATILEFASLPMIYTRESGRFDIVSAQLRFQDTGGVFTGSLQAGLHNGERGLILNLNAPSYRLAIPEEPELGRPFQRKTAQVTVEAFVSDRGGMVAFPLIQMAVEDTAVAYSGTLEQTSRGPLLSIVGQSTPMRAEHLAATWPMTISPQARRWFLENVAEGSFGAGSFSFAAFLDEIDVRDGRTFLRDDMMSLSIPYANLVMRTPGELPPIFGLDGSIELTGRTLRMTGRDGISRLQTGEMIAVPRTDFYVADHAQDDPPASLELDLEGPASGFAHMAFLDPIDLGSLLPVAPEAVSGDVSMTARIEAELADRIDRDAIVVTSQLDITNFASAEPINGRAVDEGTFRFLAGPDGTQIIGRARLDGVETDIRQATGGAPGMEIAMRLDDADRRRLGLDFGRYLTGLIEVEVGPSDANGDERMQIDLTQAVLSIPEFGFSKPSGTPARASFSLEGDGDRQRVTDLVIAADGLAVRGSLDFQNGSLRNAEFDSVAIEGVGRFALDLTRNDRSTSARVNGESFVLTPDLLRGDPEAAGALSLEVNVDELATQEGEVLRDVRLVYSQSTDQITTFDLRAKHDDGTDLAGTLAPGGNSNNIVISSGNAGTFLRFLGLYERAQGGRATLVLDPGSVGGRVEGQILLTDFEIVEEPAMRRIFSDGRSATSQGSGVVLPGEFETPDRVEIEVTNVSFDRTPERLIIHKAEGWGPSLGGNIEGVIDYEANRIQLAGTYVPFFVLNNFFSRIPIVGQALGGRDTEGLLGVTFQLVGQADNPRLEVNPISILAPGVFRNIFEFQNQQQGG